MRRYAIYLLVIPLLILSWLSLVFVDIGPSRVVALGYVLGSHFAHAALGAAWAAFGPGLLRWRVPLSLGWLAALPVAAAINFHLNRGPSEGTSLIGSAVLIQWLLALIPLGGLAWGLGLHLRHAAEAEQRPGSDSLRFGIRHLLAMMLATGVVLGIGRVVIPLIDLSTRELSVFIFLAFAAVVVTLPLLLAALMRRLAALGVGLSLLLIAAVTAAELPLLETLGGNGPNAGHFIAINVATAAVVLLVSATMRFSGYRLFTSGAAAASDRSAEPAH